MLRVIDVPAELQLPFSFPYPGHQRGPLIEEYVHNYLRQHSHEIETDHDWTYLPVYWTSYATLRPRLKKWRRLFGHPWDRRLNGFLRRVQRPGVNYFTVSQGDSGLKYRDRCVPPQPILEFNSGGLGDIPLPLLSDPHPFVERTRDIRASFLGLIKDSPIPYPCRDGMVAALAGRKEYLVQHVGNDWGMTDPVRLEQKQMQFVEALCRSVFALCPRGYGKTSYRMYEAMQLGCIPVYIYDDPWLPYTDVLDWSEFAVLVPLEDVSRLHDILSSHSAADIRRKQNRVREVYPQYFTFEATVKQLVRYVSVLEGPAERVRPLARRLAQCEY